ncbi:MAG TPA: hypothetical protein VN673_15710 [Clostridia bacterium]|nr:hypothetical protein [Clostridia bacterium]
MMAGTSQRDITPKPGGELSGFAARVQPSTGLLDPLYAKALYIKTAQSQLLWIHCDLIGYDRSIVDSFRNWAQAELRLAPDQVLLSATHTHAGPATIHLREAGEYDPAYVTFLQHKLRETAAAAMANPEKVEFVSVDSQLDLAVDRRKSASAHIDSRIAAFGFKRPDGSFLAAIINYPIHPVALGSTNRLISGDISGQASQSLSQQLPGTPVVFMTNGASGNLNPPAENVSFEQVSVWGQKIANAVSQLLQNAGTTNEPVLEVRSRMVRLPLDVLSEKELTACAESALNNAESLAQWNGKYVRVVEHWCRTLLAACRAGKVETHREAELFAVRLGKISFLGVNAEVFSDFTDWLRSATTGDLYIIAYANGDTGYLPTATAYIEGGYEVDVAHMFYGGFRPRRGSLELLAEEAKLLLKSFGQPAAKDQESAIPAKT